MEILLFCPGFGRMWEFEVYSYENLHEIPVVVLNIPWNLSEREYNGFRSHCG
jgi:hypothetical protein